MGFNRLKAMDFYRKIPRCDPPRPPGPPPPVLPGAAGSPGAGGGGDPPLTGAFACAAGI